MDLFHDPIAYALSLVAILVAVGFALRALPRREISYEVLSTAQLLTANEKMEGRLLVSFEGKPVEDISIVLFQIFNSGNQPLPARDFDRPLAIGVQGRGRILSAEVIETVPEQLAAEVATGGNEAVLAAKLLNAGDVITLKLIVTELEGSLVMRGRVVGVSDFVNAEVRWYRAGLERLLWIAGALVMGFAGLVPYSLVVLAVGPTINEWPDLAKTALVVLFIAPGIVVGMFLSDRVVRGPRARSRQYSRVLKERESRRPR